MLNQSLSKKRKSYEVLMKALMLLSIGLTAALVLFLLVYVLIHGIPNITWELLSTKPPAGIWQCSVPGARTVLPPSRPQ